MRQRGQAKIEIKVKVDESHGDPGRRDSLAARASAPTPARFQVISKGPDETVATACDCLIVVVERTVSTLGVNAIRRGLEQLSAKHERVGYFSYIEGEQCSTMNASARELMADVVQRYTTRFGAAAMVVSGGGFRSTVVRSILTGIHLASRASHPMRAFGTLAPAFAWYEQVYPDRRLHAAALRDALFELYPPSAQAIALV